MSAITNSPSPTTTGTSYVPPESKPAMSKASSQGAATSSLLKPDDIGKMFPPRMSTDDMQKALSDWSTKFESFKQPPNAVSFKNNQGQTVPFSSLSADDQTKLVSELSQGKSLSDALASIGLAGPTPPNQAFSDTAAALSTMVAQFNTAGVFSSDMNALGQVIGGKVSYSVTYSGGQYQIATSKTSGQVEAIYADITKGLSDAKAKQTEVENLTTLLNALNSKKDSGLKESYTFKSPDGSTYTQSASDFLKDNYNANKDGGDNDTARSYNASSINQLISNVNNDLSTIQSSINSKMSTVQQQLQLLGGMISELFSKLSEMSRGIN